MELVSHKNIFVDDPDHENFNARKILYTKYLEDEIFLIYDIINSSLRSVQTLSSIFQNVAILEKSFTGWFKCQMVTVIKWVCLCPC